MIQKNQFTDQIVADLDPSKIRNNQWVFPTLNFRIFNKDGKGYIASVVNGNEEIFDLREDFVIVGACEYNGIAFITSYNLYTEEGEIGSYPSVTSGSFVREYEALQNFTDGDFRTSEFNFDLEHFVDMQAKPSFDNSIDIYLCDHKNPNRVINSGFKLDGTLNDRTYSINSFEGSIDQQPYTIRDLTHNPGSTEVAIGGTLQPGNFYIFARYMTSDYGRTPFVKSFGPFCVGGGSTAVTTRGKQDQDWINGTFNKTDKKINLQLINIDQNYAFLEFGILRYSAIEENGPAIPNVYLINNRYSITSDSMYVSIYGNESEALLTLEELITSVNDYTICKSQTSVYDRWLGANWKKAGQTYDREMLAEFAKNIEIGEFEDSTSFPNDPLGAEDYGTTTVQQQYQDVDKSKEKLGYFRDQIYPFVCVFVFSNGSESEAYPMEGNVGASGATKGLYKFQGWDQRDKTQKIILGVTFNTDYAVGYYNGLSVEEKQAGFGSVIGYYFARGERIENLICQGLIIRGYHSIKVQGPTHGGTHSFQSMKSTEWGPNNNDSPEDAAILPLIRGIYPLQRRESDTTPMAYGTSKSNGNGHDSQTALPPYLYDYTTLPSNDQFSGVEVYSGINAAHSNKYGIFSPDILLNDDIVVPEECYVNPIMRFSAFEGSSWPHYSLGNDDMYLLDDDHLPEEYVLDLNEEKATFLVNDYSLYQKVHTAVTNKFQTKGNLNFGSYMATGSGIRVGDDYFKNRNIGLCKYIGVYDLSNDNLKETCTILNENGEALSIVNLYREINDSTFETSTLNSFNVPTTAYHRIYDLIPLSGTYSSAYEVYKGDCFLQKTWFRQARWYAMEDPYDKDCAFSGFGSGNFDNYCKWYQHGMMIGVITECVINTAMRNDVVGKDDSDEYIRYTFFPKCLSAGISVISYAVNSAAEYLHEATQVNNGYNKILPDKIVYGYDENEPLRDEDKPNRAYHSDPHVAGSFIDGWRTIRSTLYQDYAPVDGPITRISKFLEYPFLVQQFAINQIYVDERATQALDSGEVVMAESTTFLSDRVRKIESFGSQHMQSIIPGKTGVFGVDSMKALEWKVGIAAGKGGGFLLEAQDISLAKLIQKWFKDTFDSYSTENDIVDIIPDTPLLGQGIVGFYDPDYKEIGMSFMMEKDTGERILKTLVFDELLNSFKGEYTFVEPLYFNIGKKLYSCMYYLDDGFEYKVNNKIYRYNAEGVWNNFFGDTATAKISFIVNGLGEGKSNFAGVEKKFNAMMIEANYKSFSRIIYQTLYQSSTNTFVTASGEFWKNSEYLDQKWHIPIAVQTSVDKVQFDTGSEMSGTYMLVTLEYNLDEELNIREIETDFTPLKS